MKEKFKEALKEWDFLFIEKCLNNEKLKMESISYLYNTAQFSKIYNILKDYDKKPEWWQDGILNFYNIKEISSILEIVSDKLAFMKGRLPSDIAAVFELNNLMQNSTLTTQQALQIYKTKLHNSKNKLLKGYALICLIDYFALADDNEKRQFFCPIYTCTPIYDLLAFLNWSGDSRGAKAAWRKYHNFMQKYFKEKTPLKAPKVAFCLYGKLRGDWKTHIEEIIEKMAKPLNADVFLFSWEEYCPWPSLMGCGRWAIRVLTRELFEKIPKEIEYNVDFYKNMPLTCEKLNYEYNIKLSKQEMEEFLSKNPSVKKYKLESENLEHTTANQEKFFYGQYATFKLMESYEEQQGFIYDKVILHRVDTEAVPLKLEQIESLAPNEIGQYFETWGGGGRSTEIAGFRDAIKNCLSVWENRDIIKKAPYFGNFYPHHLWYKYPQMLGYDTVGIHAVPFSGSLSFTTALKGVKLPDIKKEVEIDLNNALKNGLLNVLQVQKISEFFEVLQKTYEPFLDYKKARLLKHRNCADIEAQLTKDTKNNYKKEIFGAKDRVKNSLSYRLGQEMLKSFTLFSKITLPHRLNKIAQEYHKEQKAYREKVAKNPFLQLPYLESYADYKEALHCKNHLSYKLGEAVIKANNLGFRPAILGGGQYGYILRLKEY
ncbi:MAG: hypothetical protein PUB96_06190 [Helicobacteraceae bacterium]|nr:hypothetical protein [Helicobacteraceae bacterium]